MQKITAIGDMRMSDKRGVMTGILLAWSKGDKYFLPQGNNFVVGLKIEIISFWAWGLGKGATKRKPREENDVCKDVV